MAESEIFASIVQTMTRDSGITESKMFGSPGLKVGGKVFTMLVKGKLVVKLPRARVEALIAAGGGAPFDPGSGRLMKEWVAIEPTDEAEWLGLVEEARQFVDPGS